MATPNGHGGWDITDEDAVEVLSKMDEDSSPDVKVDPPTEPGFYHYDGGNQSMIFLLHDNQWWAYFDNAEGPLECDWGYIEQALGVYNLRKLKPSVPDDWRMVTNLPVFLPGNNRNFEQVDGRAGITHDGKIIVTLLKEAMADELVEMAKTNIIFQIAVDYRMPLDQLEKINNQFQMEYADVGTLFKINDAITQLGYTDSEAANLIFALQKAGIVFKEMK